jgi:hypothetical protein
VGHTAVKFLPGEGNYQGDELKRNPGIPESRFEAFALPSVINGVRVYPSKKV